MKPKKDNILFDFEDLKKHRRTESCVFLGSGSSINRISNKMWGWIQSHDIWTVNNWVYHPKIIPNFYHIESKWYDYYILKRRFEEKKKKYTDCNFIFPKDKFIRMKDNTRELLSDIVFLGAKKFTYKMQSRDPKRTHKIFTANYKINPEVFTKSYDMSLTMLFEMMYKFGYVNIILFGVDLFNSYYFWTGRPECGEVHHQTNKSHEGKDPKLPHATHRIKDFIIDFNNRWMKPEKREIFVGHKDTELFGYLRKIEL